MLHRSAVPLLSAFLRTAKPQVAISCSRVPSGTFKDSPVSQHRFVSTETQPSETPSASSPPPPSSGYRFTLDSTSILSPEQRSFYETNGYLIIKGMVSSADITRWHDRFVDYATGKIKPSSPELLLQKELAVAKGDLSVNTLYKIGELYADEVLFEYCKYPKVLDYVEAFTGPNVMAIHTMLINKPPDTGSKSSRHPLHQDLHYFPNRPAERIVCAWTAMERITRENGCLVAIPGSHSGPHLSHDYPDWEGGVNKLYYGVQVPDSVAESRVHLLMDEGDTVLFHPLLIHGSGMNRTKGYRKAISCHYATGDSEFIDVKGTIQEKLAEETLGVFTKRFPGVKMDYSTFWKLRARLVRGENTGKYDI